MAEKRVVICGGGIIGMSTAYYLLQKGVTPVLIERNEVAGTASGKAGGFLALDWNDTTPVGPLARLSFKLHQELAKTLGENYGYRQMDTLGVATSEEHQPLSRIQPQSVPAWVDRGMSRVQVLGSKQTTAQIHPYKFAQALLKATKKEGLQVKYGCVEGITYANETKGKVKGVIVDGKEVDADVVVIALGPWSKNACKWLPLPSISAKKVHSIVLKPTEPLTAHALFMNIRTSNGSNAEPEVYPRPDGEVYICGEGEPQVPPDDPCDVEVRPNMCNRLRKLGGLLSSALANADVIKQQACYMPISPDDVPMIGRVPGVDGAFVATGHSCWGILNGPATGLLISELIVDGKAHSLDIASFDPARFLGASVL